MKKLIIPCVLLIAVLLSSCAAKQEESAKDSSILWPDADYETLSAASSEKYAYQNAVQAQLDYDEYVYLPGENGADVVEGWDGEYFLFAADAQRLYPKLDFTEEIGQYGLAGIAIFSDLAETFSAEDQEYYKVYKRSFSTSDIKSVHVTYLSGEDGLSYEEYYDTAPEELLAKYADSSALPGEDNAWLCKTEYETNAALEDRGDYCAVIAQGERTAGPYGFITISTSKDDTAEALEEILPTADQIRPILG